MNTLNITKIKVMEQVGIVRNMLRMHLCKHSTYVFGWGARQADKALEQTKYISGRFSIEKKTIMSKTCCTKIKRQTKRNYKI